jgi:hypothetical protein
MEQGRGQGVVWVWLLCLMLVPDGRLGGQPGVEPQGMPVPPRTGNRLFGSAGIGLISLKRGGGVDIPLGFTALLGRYRLIGTVNALDLGLMQGKSPDSRYYRPYLGNSLCVDGQSNRRVPDYYCSGTTDLLGSASADLSFICFDEVWIGNQPGKLFAGVGQRFFRPRTLYGVFGLFFAAPSRRAGSFRVAVGQEYVHVGVVWGIDLGRLFR